MVPPILLADTYYLNLNLILSETAQKEMGNGKPHVVRVQAMETTWHKQTQQPVSANCFCHFVSTVFLPFLPTKIQPFPPFPPKQPHS